MNGEYLEALGEAGESAQKKSLAGSPVAVGQAVCRVLQRLTQLSTSQNPSTHSFKPRSPVSSKPAARPPRQPPLPRQLRILQQHQ